MAEPQACNERLMQPRRAILSRPALARLVDEVLLGHILTHGLAAESVPGLVCDLADRDRVQLTEAEVKAGLSRLSRKGLVSYKRRDASGDPGLAGWWILDLPGLRALDSRRCTCGHSIPTLDGRSVHSSDCDMLCTPVSVVRDRYLVCCGCERRHR